MFIAHILFYDTTQSSTCQSENNTSLVSNIQGTNGLSLVVQNRSNKDFNLSSIEFDFRSWNKNSFQYSTSDEVLLHHGTKNHSDAGCKDAASQAYPLPPSPKLTVPLLIFIALASSPAPFVDGN